MEAENSKLKEEIKMYKLKEYQSIIDEDVLLKVNDIYDFGLLDLKNEADEARNYIQDYFKQYVIISPNPIYIGMDLIVKTDYQQ